MFLVVLVIMHVNGKWACLSLAFELQESYNSVLSRMQCSSQDTIIAYLAPYNCVLQTYSVTLK